MTTTATSVTSVRGIRNREDLARTAGELTMLLAM